MKDELKIIYNVGKKVLAVPKWAFIITHTVPTFVRKAYEYDKENGLSSEEGTGISPFAVALGGVGSVCTAQIYFLSAANQDNPYFFGAGVFCIASNVASGLYEWCRYERNKLKSPAADIITSGSGLEEKVKEEKPTEESKPIEIFDPWKVNIKELENIAYGGRR